MFFQTNYQHLGLVLNQKKKKKKNTIDSYQCVRDGAYEVESISIKMLFMGPWQVFFLFLLLSYHELYLNISMPVFTPSITSHALQKSITTSIWSLNLRFFSTIGPSASKPNQINISDNFASIFVRDKHGKQTRNHSSCLT